VVADADGRTLTRPPKVVSGAMRRLNDRSFAVSIMQLTLTVL